MPRIKRHRRTRLKCLHARRESSYLSAHDTSRGGQGWITCAMGCRACCHSFFAVYPMAAQLEIAQCPRCQAITAHPL